MTEKRFTVEDDDADIWENNYFLAVAYNHINAKKITKRLNKLSDENEKLNQLIQQKITDVTERTGYLFTPKQTEAALQVLNELKNELKT